MPDAHSRQYEQVAALSETIARAASPWEWRSRRSVVVLVIAMVALTAVGILNGWLNNEMNPVVAFVFLGLFGVVGFVRPAVRSLRRWDEAHTENAA